MIQYKTWRILKSMHIKKATTRMGKILVRFSSTKSQKPQNSYQVQYQTLLLIYVFGRFLWHILSLQQYFSERQFNPFWNQDLSTGYFIIFSTICILFKIACHRIFCIRNGYFRSTNGNGCDGMLFTCFEASLG